MWFIFLPAFYHYSSLLCHSLVQFILWGAKSDLPKNNKSESVLCKKKVQILFCQFEMMNRIKIVNYNKAHQPYFEKFNRQWIEELFVMEPVDEFVVTNPEVAIIDGGGAILMAGYEDNIAGTVALRKVDDTTFEFTKMAVDKDFRRKGIAEALSYASFQKAHTLGASKVILYSNTKNAGAIKLYEKLGFQHVDVEPGVYERANVKMVIGIADALRAAEKYFKADQEAV
jgi:ribosomal protein S18 acetylase RimI-like enzyme